MIVFEIATPGTWLDYEDRNWASRIEEQLRSLESQFFVANTALNLFIGTQSIRPSFADRENWERDSQRRSEIRRAIEQEHAGIHPWENFDEIYFETEVRFKREKWAAGSVPRAFEHNLPFIYARAFLYALDAFDKFLGVLAKEENVPREVATHHAKIADAFPHLRGVRNTAQHLEDRARGLGAGRNPQPLELKPIENGFFNAPGGGVLVLNCLIGSKYGSTMSDGHYGEIDVAPESMLRLREILEAVLSSFKWRGPKRHAPNL
ncbi:hypothetical protein [Paraburkholderia adhaesiva]|uniref:hypothetical protein n=1 Tax=Paraburkholderia adhaesiva TaxID=2883244 RepID=UPI001F2EAA08|nr:hypothetical protein [Paraburkholderia adhaesiva]